MASEQVGEQRRTRLLEFLSCEHQPTSQVNLIVTKEYRLTEENLFEIDPMIGMDNVTPFDFV